MFTTTMQFSSLSLHRVEGLEVLIQRFFDIMVEFKRKPYDLLDFSKNAFDRDYLEYTVNIAELEQQSTVWLMNLSLLNTVQALSLLKQFEDILTRDSLKADLDSKYTVIFHNYGLDLEAVQRLYERQKSQPPMLRNAPPVTGNILWAKQLLRRIEEPMKRFKVPHPTLTTRRLYNKVARALVEFETLWHNAWARSIEAARSGLQATLIIRHPTTGRLFVNFDREILQLIRETKLLQRSNVDIPDNARMVLVQEDKFKSYFNQLSFALREYERVVDLVNPAVRPLLTPHLNDLDAKIMPGMVLLTWQSMNIDSYLQRIHAGLSRFEELVRRVNDILENRVEQNLKSISKALLVELPSDESFTLEQFVTVQEKTTKGKTAMLDLKNEEVERALRDVMHLISAYPLETEETIPRHAMFELWTMYSNKAYMSILRCTKQSFFALKKRLAARGGIAGLLYVEKPFFNVDIELSLPLVTMNPSLDEIQGAINRCALNILRCSKSIYQWAPTPVPVPRTDRETFHRLIAGDYQIVAVCLMLTGAVEGTKKQVHDYLLTFMNYDFLWKEDRQNTYKWFAQTKPTIEDFERELQKYVEVEQRIASIQELNTIGCLALKTAPLKASLRTEADMWKQLYSDNLLAEAQVGLKGLTDYMVDVDQRLEGECPDLDTVREMMTVLSEVRGKETDMELDIQPIQRKYNLLLKYSRQVIHLPNPRIPCHLALSQSIWANQSRDAADKLNQQQHELKNRLQNDVRAFTAKVKAFRTDFEANGPMEDGITSDEAAKRLEKYKKVLILPRQRARGKPTFCERLFGLKVTLHPELEVTRKELELLDQLYSLYVAVTRRMKELEVLSWSESAANVEHMKKQIAGYSATLRKLPKQLRSWDAFKEVPPSLHSTYPPPHLSINPPQTLLNPPVQATAGSKVDLSASDLTLGQVLEMGLHRIRDEVEEICGGAVKEVQVETKLEGLQEEWADIRFEFQSFKNKGPVILKELALIVEKLEESHTVLGAMASNAASVPFRDQVQSWIQKLSSVSEVVEQWTVVQSLWIYMEAVFLSGDMAKQLPQDAKRFAGVDKSYMRLTARAFETPNVILICHGSVPNHPRWFRCHGVEV
ncbi:dynein heavy chain, N-terminal region 1-domain-containing protein [Baffinella frigidus]|nr:dynein heavy chain, N-terminal region 1-domain-containing protein [Cryptophyta sp. CCMP2293]